MFLPLWAFIPQEPRKMGPTMHEESVFYNKNTQKSNLFAASAAFWIFSREPRLYKRVCPSVGRSVGPSLGPLVGPLVGNAFVSACRDEPAND